MRSNPLGMAGFSSSPFCASLVPLAAVIFQCMPGYLHTMGWKSSLLPIFFHGLDIDVPVVEEIDSFEIQKMKNKTKNT